MLNASLAPNISVCYWGLPNYSWASQVVLVIKNLPANAEDKRDMGLIPGSGGSLGEGYGNPLQYSCLENPMDRGAWRATVHGVTKSLTWLKRFSTHKSSLTPSTMWRHRKDSCLWTRNPYQTRNLPVPQSWTPQPPELWDINVCRL